MLTPSDKWPDIGEAVGRAVVDGEADFGVVMCWTGTGTAIAANKVPGVRAALAWDPWIAKGARLWNDANVLAMSLKRLAPDVAVDHGPAHRFADVWPLVGWGQHDHFVAGLVQIPPHGPGRIVRVVGRIGDFQLDSPGAGFPVAYPALFASGISDRDIK
jgi:hypothetical protein